ncbi:MAG: chemotaxis signal transduction protein [Proteobacteria bacterium]|nr:chemotaxis signal transduction protein [Pseudomonadota bacterium]
MQSAGLSRLGVSWDIIGRIADAVLSHRASRILQMIRSTRDEFLVLEQVLQSELDAATHKNSLSLLRFRARQAVDILFRNLYERTADIGYLSQDADIRRFVTAGAEEDVESIRHRLAEYTQKYSVYRDVVIFSTKGEILTRLDAQATGGTTGNAFFQRTLHATGYVESFGAFDFLEGTRNLIYSQTICDDAGQIIGVLALVFLFENEMAGIFRDLGVLGMTCMCLSDAEGQILASSDEAYLEPGKHIPVIENEDGREVVFMGRKFLMVSHRGKPYQSYQGPAWYGHALVPKEYLSETGIRELPEGTLGDVLGYVDVLCPALRSILDSAQRVNTALRIVVWNGSIEAIRNQDISHEPLKAILRQIQQAGAETAQAFSDAIGKLITMEVSSYLRTGSDLARLAGNIMDRNLYERSDDCRWWALTSELRAILAQPALSAEDSGRMEGILTEINTLYTVYTRLFVFDTAGCVLAASNLHGDEITLRGEVLSDDWVKHALALTQTRQYVVSPFSPTYLYAGFPTYVYAAAIRAPEHEDKVVGGIGIVFDSGPEFRRMLDDCLPDFPGAYALYVERDSRRVIAESSGAGLGIGEAVQLDPAFFDLLPGQSHEALTVFRGQYNVVAAVASNGYREYKTSGDYCNPVISLVVLPVGVPPADSAAQSAQGQTFENTEVITQAAHFATFFVCGERYALPAASVCETIPADTLTAASSAATPYLAGTILYRDSTSSGSNLPTHLTVLDAARFFSHHETPLPVRAYIIVIRVQKKLLGLLVDSLDAVPTIDASRIGHANLLPQEHYGFSHAAILPAADAPGQRPILVLDETFMLRLVESLSALAPAVQIA